MSNIKDELKKLAERFELQKNSVLTEAQTKHSFILPFVTNVLGFDTTDLNQVEFELNADVGFKNAEKVDIALKKDGKLLVIIEAKHHKEKNLDPHINQLMRYFNFTNAKFGILTNGYTYRIYTDTEAQNKMDTQPFLEFDIDNATKEQISELENFKFAKINIEAIFNRAETLRTENIVKKSIKEELKNPSKEFVSLFVKKISEGKRLTEKIQNQYSDIIKESANKIILEEAKSYLDKVQNQVGLSENVISSNSTPEINEENIETTPEEKELYYIVKAIAGQVVNPDEIKSKDTKGYFSMQYVNGRQTFLRFWQTKGKITLLSNGDALEEKTIEIGSPSDLYNHMEDINKYVLTFKK